VNGAGPICKRVMIVFGTRPEAIKMAPLVHAIAAHPRLQPVLVVSGQHRQMLDSVLATFGLQPDADLAVMESRQSLSDLTARVLQGMGHLLATHRPDMVLVHGDTTTTLSAALAAFYARIPIGHVEAGLRTGNLLAPWPEEMNRRLTAPLCALHFAPTNAARDNLLREGIEAGRVHVTGNTVIDALLQVDTKLHAETSLREAARASLPPLDARRRLVLVTGHRRENFGDGFEGICKALSRLAQRSDVQVIYPVHLNPQVREPVHRLLAGLHNVHLIEPLDYLPFVFLMRRADVILTDSGGIQEEAPSLGKPVLVMRDTTERPEAIAAGTAQLVGTDPDRIVAAVERILDGPPLDPHAPVDRNPYGDGQASARIADIIDTSLNRDEN
jgi:UDP-N-acetylglucosamine 2-epimerase (non-hydrolysing)